MKRVSLAKASGAALAGVLLAALCFCRLFAVLHAHVPAMLLGGASVLLSVGVLYLIGRFGLLPRFFLPKWAGWKTGVTAAAAFLLGAGLDLTYWMFDPLALLPGGLTLRVLCMAGSGVFFAGTVLALTKAALEFGRIKLTGWTTFLLTSLVLNVFAALYISNSATVYTWDNAGYWTVAATLAKEAFGPRQLHHVLQTILTHDYNYLLAYPISLVMRLFGTSRYVFIFTTVNLYLLPGVLGLFVLAGRLKRGLLLPLLFVPMLFYISLIGFVDVASASLAIWAYVLYTDRDRPGAPAGLLAGALLTGTFLLRRYFFFFAVSFGIAAFLVALLRRKDEWHKFLALFIGAAGTAVFMTQSFLVEKILASNYGNIYSAYQQGLRTDILMFGRYFGVVILLLAAALGVFLLTRRARRGPALLALVQSAVCFFLLTRVQSHGSQHLLLYAPAVAVLLTEGLAALPDLKSVYWCALALGVLTTASPIAPRPQPLTATEIKHLAPLPSFSYASPRREDIGQLIALHAYVDGLSAGEQKTAAVVSSSFLFNSETYTNLYASLGLDPGIGPSTPIIYMSAVDKRDGFSWNVLGADYLLVGDPVQTHLGEENQQVVAILAHDVLEGVGVGEAYRLLDASFVLEGATVRIYERTREITELERQSISDRLTQQYPEFAELYKAR